MKLAQKGMSHWVEEQKHCWKIIFIECCLLVLVEHLIGRCS